MEARLSRVEIKCRLGEVRRIPDIWTMAGGREKGGPRIGGAIVRWRKRYEMDGAGDPSTGKQSNRSYSSACIDEYRQGEGRHVR